MADFGALFDLDGVIIDSEERYTEFWNDIERIYPTGIENYAVAIKGTTLPVILRNYPTEEIREDIHRRLIDYQDRMEFDFYPGAIEFLRELKSNGIPAALVTSSDERKMARLFGQNPELRGLFVTVIDGDMVTRSKPDPEGYLKAAAAVGVALADCFVFEDSIQGLAAGRASGAVVVGVATTYPASKLIGKADAIVGTLAEMNVGRLSEIRASLSRP